MTSSSRRSASSTAWPSCCVKAAPLILIAVGLAVGFRAKVWNIGAEGQFILGAICAGGVGAAFHEPARAAGCCR